MGGSISREAEISNRITESISGGHVHTLQLLLKFIQHMPGGSPTTQVVLGKTGSANGSGAASAAASSAITSATTFNSGTKPPRPALSVSNAVDMDEATAAFHTRAALLAQSQALSSGATSASFPLPIDLDAIQIGGENLLTAAIRFDTNDSSAGLSLLLNTGIELDLQDRLKGYTPLHHAVILNRINCIRALLSSHACSLVHGRLDGLKASQLTRNEEAREMLHEAERKDEMKLIEMITQNNNDDDDDRDSSSASIEQHPLFTTSTSLNFPYLLYSVHIPSSTVLCDLSPATNPTNTLAFSIQFRSPAVRAASDCICMYYVDDPVGAPAVMRPRHGSVWYIGTDKASVNNANAPTPTLLGLSTLAITLHLRNLPMSSYRFVYFDSARQQIMACSEILTLQADGEAPKPVQGWGSWFGWGGGSSAQKPVTPAAVSATSTVMPSVSIPSVKIQTPKASSSFSASSSSLSSTSSSSSSGSSTVSSSLLHPSFRLLTTPSYIQRYFLSTSPSPPSYFRSHFTLNKLAAKEAMAGDSRLPGVFKDALIQQFNGKEEEFWVRYFWAMMKLEDVTNDGTAATATQNSATIAASSSAATLVKPVASSSSPITTSAASSTSSYIPPTSTYVPPSSTYVPPASTYVPPSSTYVPPTTTATTSASSLAVPAKTSASSSSTTSPQPTRKLTAQPTPSKPIPVDEEDVEESEYVPPAFASLSRLPDPEIEDL